MAARPTHILVVADEATTEALSQAVRQADYDAEIVAAHPEEAVVEIDRFHPDVVLISTAEDGEVIRVLREARSDVPMVAVGAPPNPSGDGHQRIDVDALRRAIARALSQADVHGSESTDGGTTALETAGGDRLRVLVVVDSEDDRMLLSELLRAAAVEVAFAGDPSSAVQRATDEAFDAVLIDVQMPKLDAYEMSRELARAVEAGRRSPPVIALAARVIGETLSRGLEAVCAKLLTKPFHRRTLLDALAHVTGARLVEKQKPLRKALRAEVLPLLPKFFAHRRNDLRVIRDALARSELRTIATLAHNMRGTGASYGFPEITALGEALQEAGKREDEESIARITNQLEKLLDELESTMADVLGLGCKS